MGALRGGCTLCPNEACLRHLYHEWVRRAATDRRATPLRSAKQAVAFVLRGHGRPIAAIATAAFLGGLAEAVFLITVTRAAFAITNGHDRVGIIWGWYLDVGPTLVFAVGLIAVRITLAAHASWHSAQVASRVITHIRSRLSRAFLTSSWEVQQAQRSGSLQELLTTFSMQATGLVGSVSGGVVAAANLVALLGTAIAVEPVGAVVLVLSVSVLGLLLRPLRSAVRRRAREANAAGMEFATSVNEVSVLGLELHVFHVQDKAHARLAEANDRARKIATRLYFVASLSTPVYMGLAYLAVIGALGVATASHSTNLTSLGAAMLVMLRSLTYGQAIQGSYLGVSGAVPAIEELQHRLQVFEAGHRPDIGQPVDSVGALAMDRVSFGYSAGETVLRDISFTIEPHEIVGIVGPSGAGKSTLVQLLLGLRDPVEGRVLAGGRDISTLSRADWARKVTFVPQASHLIAGTIADNIRFFRDNVSPADIERAARLAQLHDDVIGFPEGYERRVGEQGGHLSGGQQQRLSIARALVEQPEVLVLDEPTSALDVRSEHLVRDTLLGLRDRMTVIVIAHRLSTLTICDRIMVVKDGQMKDFDTPHRLERSSEFYREALTLSGLR